MLHAFTHGGRVTYICVSKLTIIGSDNDLMPSRQQCWDIVYWTLRKKKLQWILIKVYTYSFKEIHLNVVWNWRPYYLDLIMLSHAVKMHVYTSLNRWSKENRDVQLSTCLCKSFSYIMHQYILNNLLFLSYYILNSLWPGDMLRSYWWTMVSPTQLRCRRHGSSLYQRCTAVCIAVLCQHWLEWWRAACSVPGHHPSQWSHTVYWIPDWILMILSQTQQSSCENAFEMSPANGGLSAAASVSYCH